MDSLTGHKQGKKGKDASALPVVQISEPGSPSEGSTGDPSPTDKGKPAAAEAVAQPSASYFKLYRCVYQLTATARSTSILCLLLQSASCKVGLVEPVVHGRSRLICTDRTSASALL